MLGISDLKTGKHVVYEGDPYTIAWNQFSKTGRQGGVMKTKMKNLKTGGVVEKTFQGNDKLEPAEIGYRKAQFLYANGDDFEFMDNETYEPLVFTRKQLGETVNFLSDGMDTDVQYFNGTPINVQVPAKMAFEIVETEPGVKGDTAGTANKMATIETGFVVKVPLFIEKGEKVVINTLTGDYCERFKS